MKSLRMLLGLFQLGHYDAALFRAWLGRHPAPEEWLRFAERAVPTWSLKARLLFGAAAILALGQSKLAPRALIAASVMLKPLERLVTAWIAFWARRRLRRIATRAVIGITGSFGKTTTKEILAALLARKYRVEKTPENINTLLGVAHWIRDLEVNRDTVLIVEMGAYHRGDIAALARLVRPTVGIFTGLNEAHRERFGTLEETAAAKFELADTLPRGAPLWWNDDSPTLCEAMAKRQAALTGRGVRLFAYGRHGARDIRLECSGAGEGGLTIGASDRTDPAWNLTAPVALLGRHHLVPISAAVAVARHLGLGPEEIKRGLESLRPLGRRLAPMIAAGNRLIVDDSYNITLDGAAAAFDLLGAIRRRKVGLFAGIPEGGQESARVNRELGRMAAGVFAVILLRQTPATDDILAGLRERGFNEANIRRYTESRELEPLLASVLKDGDCLYLSAYDWPAIYL